ncbi:MAG: hemerythrin family protein [Rhodospirillaceae bacterium]
MGFFDWLKKPAYAEPVYTVMNDDHVHLYNILGELRQGGGHGQETDAAREARRKHCLTIVKRLLVESVEHFKREEMLMLRYGYPKAAAHKTEHLIMTRSMEMYQSQLSAGSLPPARDIAQYLKNWLTNHIRTTDRLLERFLFDAAKSRDSHGLMALNAADYAQYRALSGISRGPRDSA